MSMTTELIERLRTNANWLDEEDNDERAIRKSMLEAADTIQLLSEKLHASQTEPCEDAISRQAVLDILDRHTLSRMTLYEIEDLPSVQPEQRWIPCEKRMPEDSKSVLFCDIDGDIMIGYHIKGRPKTHFTENGSWEDIKNVRAWMPLPEPFKEEGE